MIQEGRLTNVDVLGYEKRYDPEKYYVYVLRIYRENQATSFVLYRSYKHFTELYQKICLHFPLAKVHRLVVISIYYALVSLSSLLLYSSIFIFNTFLLEFILFSLFTFFCIAISLKLVAGG